MDSSADEQTPVISKIADQLVHCARMGDVHRMRQLLLRDGVDVNHPSSLGLRPLSVAARHGHEKVARLLLEKGADAKAHDTYGGRGAAPLHWATTNNHKRIVALLLDAGADVAAVDFNGGTPLHDAARRGNTGVVSMLLAAGANPLARDFEGHTPRDMAASDETRTILRRSGILSGTRPSSLPEKQQPTRASRENRSASRTTSPRRREGSLTRSPERPHTSNTRSNRYPDQSHIHLRRQSIPSQGKIHSSRAQMFTKRESQPRSRLSPYEQIVTHYHNQHINTRNDQYGSVESESFYSENGGSQMALLGPSLKNNNKIDYSLPGQTSHALPQKKAYKGSQNTEYKKPQNIVYNNPVEDVYKRTHVLPLPPTRKAHMPSSVTDDRSPIHSAPRSSSPTRLIPKVDPESLSKFCDEFIHQSILMATKQSKNLPPSQYSNQSRPRPPTPPNRQSSSEPTQRAVPQTPRTIMNQAQVQSPRVVTPSQPRKFPALTQTIYNYEQITPFVKDVTNDTSMSNIHPEPQSQENEKVLVSPQTHSSIPSFGQTQSQLNPSQCLSSQHSQPSAPSSFLSDSQCFSPPYNQIALQRPISPRSQLSEGNPSSSPSSLSPCPQAQFLSEISMESFEPIPTPPFSQVFTESILQTFTQPIIQAPTEPINHTISQPFNQISISPNNHMTAQTFNQAFIQSLNQPSSLPINQSLIQTINQTNTPSVYQQSQAPTQILNTPVNQTNLQPVAYPLSQPTSQSVNQHQTSTKTLNYSSNPPNNLPCTPPFNIITAQATDSGSTQPMSLPFNQPVNQASLESTGQSIAPSTSQMSSQSMNQASSLSATQTFSHISAQPENQTSQLINEAFDQMATQLDNQLYTQNPIPTTTQPLNQAHSQRNNQTSSPPQPYTQTVKQQLKQSSPEISSQLFTQMPTQVEQSTRIQEINNQPLSQTSTPLVIEPRTKSLSGASTQLLLRISAEHVNNTSSQPLSKPSTELNNKPSRQFLTKSTNPFNKISTQPPKLLRQPLKKLSAQSTTSLTQSARSLTQSSSHPLINSSTQTLSLRMCKQPSESPTSIPIRTPTPSLSRTVSSTNNHSPSQGKSPHSLPTSPSPTDLSSPDQSLSSSYSPNPTPTQSHSSFPSRSRATSPYQTPTQSRSLSYQRQYNSRSSRNVFLSKQNITHSQNFATQIPTGKTKQNVEIVVEQQFRNLNQQLSKKNKSAENVDELSNDNDSRHRIHDVSKHPSRDITEEPVEYCKHHSRQHSGHRPAHAKLHRIKKSVGYKRTHKVAKEPKGLKNHTSLTDHLQNSQTGSCCDVHNCENENHHQDSNIAHHNDDNHHHPIHGPPHHSPCPKAMSQASGLYSLHKCGINFHPSTAYRSPDTSQNTQKSQSLCATNKTDIQSVVTDANFRHTHDVLVDRGLDTNSTCPLRARCSQSQSNDQNHADVIASLIPCKSHHELSNACLHTECNEPHVVTELVELANSGRDDAVISFLNKGINIDKPDPKMRINALHLASRNGHFAAVTTLLRCGANLESEDDEGVTALHWASSNGHARVVHTLLKEGAKVDAISKHGRSPLHEAAAGGHGMVVNLLLQAGADPRRKDKMMLSPLDIATGFIHSTLMQHSM